MPNIKPTATVTIDDLTDRQATFVREYVERGGTPGAGVEAAVAAGYSNGDRKIARIRASELLRNERVLKVLRDEISNKLSSAAALAINVLIDLAQNGPPQVRLSAARELLDRGFGPVMSRNAHLHAVAPTSIEDIIDILDR